METWKKKEREMEKKKTYTNLTLSPAPFWYHGYQLKQERYKPSQLCGKYLLMLFHPITCLQQSTLTQNIWYAIIFSSVQKQWIKVSESQGRNRVWGSTKKHATSLRICTYNFTQHKPLTKKRAEVCVCTDLWFRILKWSRKHHSILGVCIFASELVCR